MSTALNTSNVLADLRERAKAEHAAVTGAMKASLSHAFTAGEILIEAKEQLRHGEWLPWLESCGIPERTAQRYIRLARNRVIIEAKSDTVSDLGVAGALALLTLSKTSRRDSMGTDAAKIAHDAVDVAFTWDQFDREERYRKDNEPAKRKQRELMDEARSALDTIGDMVVAWPELASLIERIFDECGSRFGVLCSDYKSVRLGEMGLTEETYETIAAEIAALKKKGASPAQILWHVGCRELAEMKPLPGNTSASITAIATAIRDIAADALRQVEQAAEAPAA